MIDCGPVRVAQIGARYSPGWSQMGVWNPGVQERTPTGTDIARHVQPGYSYRRDLGESHWAHETAHEINSKLRNAIVRSGAAGNPIALYCLGGNYWWVPQPRVRLSQVAAEVPAGLRGSTYQVYLVNARQWWEDSPLYVLEEWTPYLIGSETVLDQARQGRTPRNESLTFDNGLRFCGYAGAALRAIRKHDPSYRHLADLERFCEWSAAWAFAQAEDAARFSGLESPERKRIIAEIRRHFPKM